MPTLRKQVIRLAASLPKGSPERQALLQVLAKDTYTLDSVEKVVRKEHENLVNGLNAAQNAVARMSVAASGNDIARKHITPPLMEIAEGIRDASKQVNLIGHIARHLTSQYGE